MYKNKLFQPFGGYIFAKIVFFLSRCDVSSRIYLAHLQTFTSTIISMPLKSISKESCLVTQTITDRETRLIINDRIPSGFVIIQPEQ